MKNYFDQLTDKDITILIPGAGNSYEGEYLWNLGFKNVFIVDISKEPLHEFKTRVPDFPQDQLIHANFFDIEKKFDLIVEQTFFCALDPSLRENYALKMHDLLNGNGKLVGLLFNFPLSEQGPPFGGNKLEYLNYFENRFAFDVFEDCYNSIGPRNGKEYFIKLIKID